MPQTALSRAYREDGGQVLAALIAQFRDFDLAEEALAEAFARAAVAWQDAIPDRPAAWLLTVARRLALDRIRAGTRHARHDMTRAVTDALYDPPQPQSAEESIDEAPIPDDRLRLIFTCCHPALAREAQVALTLRTLGGLSIDEIARAFLVKPGALARRLTRAKDKIRAAHIPYQIPGPRDLPDRLPQVLEVIYLIYNESYAASQGDSLTRTDLGAEALRLARLVHGLLPLPETRGLLALILHHSARRPARLAPDGALIPLEHQDRGIWDSALIAEGKHHLLHALAARRPGPYQLQAAISAVHNDAATWADTDWRQIAGLYAMLDQMDPSPVVRLNRAVALAHAGDTGAAQDLLGPLAEDLADYHPYHAACGDLARRQGDAARANRAFARAADLTGNAAEKRFLRAQIHAATGDGG